MVCADDIAHRLSQNLWYRQLGATNLTEIQRVKGMLDCPDYQVAEVQSLLGMDGSPAPLEVAIYGAATGVREASFLIRNTRVGTIHLVEVSDHYDANAIAKKFGNDSEIADEVRRATGRNQVPQFRVDYNTNVSQWQTAKDHPLSVIFWMFAGIMELNHNEKQLAVIQAYKNLGANGVIVVDVPLGPVTSIS